VVFQQELLGLKREQSIYGSIRNLHLKQPERYNFYVENHFEEEEEKTALTRFPNYEVIQLGTKFEKDTRYYKERKEAG